MQSTETRTPDSPPSIGREVLSLLLIFLPIGILGAIGYIFFIGRILGRGDLALVGALFTLPLFILVCGAIWLTALTLLDRRRGQPLALGSSTLLALGVALLFGLVVAGPRGFTLAGGSELVNVALLLFVGIAAFLHRRRLFRRVQG